jgi:hypothetical protein
MESDIEEADSPDIPDPCVAGAIPFPSKVWSDIKEQDTEKLGKDRATFMDSFNSLPMKLAKSYYPEPLFPPEVIDITGDAA